MLAITMPAITPIARRRTDDSLGLAIPPDGAGGTAESMTSPLDWLPALRAELHVARDLVTVRALDRLGRTALPAELEAGGQGLAALHARLPDGRRVGPAVPAELRGHGGVLAALRTRLDLLLGRGGHRLGDLRGHPVPHPDPRAEAHAHAGAAAGGVRRGGLESVGPPRPAGRR